jgi:hypothetical protein
VATSELVLGLAGIGGTAFGALSTQVAAAWTKRGDRKHEVNLAFDERVWEDKKTVLIGVIATLSEMRRACEPDSSWLSQGQSEEDQFARMRTRAL